MLKRFFTWLFEPDDEEDLEDTHGGGPLPQTMEGDWVVMPWRVAEACRLSMITIGNHPKMPEEIAQWIAQWMNGYNESLANYFRENYGPDIFEVLDSITKGVQGRSEEYYTELAKSQFQESFTRWEQELGGEHGDRKPPTDTPPAS